MTEVALTPAACYGVYPTVAARGRLSDDGAVVDVYAFCFRNEPSIDPARMQMFRQREHVRVGTHEQTVVFRDLWMIRGRAIVESFGLPCDVAAATDPFFGRAGKLLATHQREEHLKFELLVPITSKEVPTACVSFNDHRDLFGRVWSIETAAGEPAHSACVGFGVERIALALFKHHGFAFQDWPRDVRDVLGL
jgi:seryl-tRNA synthetase